MVEAAPILLRHVLGLDGEGFADYCRRSGWTWERQAGVYQLVLVRMGDTSV